MLGIKNWPVLSSFILVLALVAGCSRGKAPVKTAGVPVLVAQAFVTNVPVQIDPPPVGHVAPMQTVNVRSQIGGIISAVNFQEGQEVKQGDLLFTIDPRPAQAALALARANVQRDEAQLANARIQFSRDQKLFDQNLISQDVYDTSRATLDALAGTVAADHAAVTNEELNVEYTEIRAPIAGRTGSLKFHAGNVVKSPDDILVTINQIHPINVEFAVPEQYLPEIRKQMSERALPVSVTFQNLEGSPPAGKLTFVDNTVDETTGTIPLKATFPNAHGNLWPGQFVSVNLMLSELTNVVVVPSQAVQTGQDGEFVFVVNADHTVVERPVTVGLTHHGQTVISQNLKAGETVVTDGQLRLTPGVSVNIKDALESALPAGSTNAP
jgi:multidrug efflux system membrane fusion protein